MVLHCRPVRVDDRFDFAWDTSGGNTKQRHAWARHLGCDEGSCKGKLTSAERFVTNLRSRSNRDALWNVTGTHNDDSNGRSEQFGDGIGLLRRLVITTRNVSEGLFATISILRCSSLKLRSSLGLNARHILCRWREPPEWGFTGIGFWVFEYRWLTPPALDMSALRA